MRKRTLRVEGTSLLPPVGLGYWPGRQWPQLHLPSLQRSSLRTPPKQTNLDPRTFTPKPDRNFCFLSPHSPPVLTFSMKEVCPFLPSAPPDPSRPLSILYRTPSTFQGHWSSLDLASQASRPNVLSSAPCSVLPAPCLDPPASRQFSVMGPVEHIQYVLPRHGLDISLIRYYSVPLERTQAPVAGLLPITKLANRRLLSDSANRPVRF